MTHSSVKLGDTTFTSTYHFIAGGHGTGSLTNLVSSITQTGGNCGYGYDDNGNITSATVNGKWAGYAYDELGQLVRVNDRSDARAGEDGSTWVYEYDQGGNILSKKLYPYADTSSTPLETTTFTYGNPNWKDQLTAVNGVAITYDAIGNPLNDGTWTYTWQNGRQLAGMSKSGMAVSFKYNANGLRTHKIVNGVVTNYTLHGKNVVHMTKGNDSLHFFYDAQNKPAVVVYNGTAYAYVKNLQGDIIAILDSAGTAVVSYTYDAWGAPTSTTGTMAATLGVLNPFRYRGYVYDEETELYYLRSRYYTPLFMRFCNMDKVIHWNTYAYCVNNPINFIDQNGNYPGAANAKMGMGNLIAAIFCDGMCGASVGGVIDQTIGGKHGKGGEVNEEAWGKILSALGIISPGEIAQMVLTGGGIGAAVTLIDRGAKAGPHALCFVIPFALLIVAGATAVGSDAQAAIDHSDEQERDQSKSTKDLINAALDWISEYVDVSTKNWHLDKVLEFIVGMIQDAVLDEIVE